MGIYDRDYYQEPRRSGITLHAPRTIIGIVILVNVVIYLVDGLFTPETHDVSDMLGVRVGTLTQPWLWWQLITYGFAHSPAPSHILFNMLTLFFLGRDIESTYGRKEFLRLYLTMLLVAGLGWAITSKLQGMPDRVMAYGASGAVAGVVVLYALHFPRRTLLLFFVVPVPAWLVGVMVVLYDMYGAGSAGGSNIAHSAHLSGAAFAFLYYKFGWNLTRLTDRFSPTQFKPRPKLRIHDPKPDQPDQANSDNLTEQVDRILEKIHREGENSLTRKERRTLESASRQYQKRKES